MDAIDFNEASSTIWGVFVGSRGCELPTFSSPNGIFPPEEGTEGYVAIGWAAVGSMMLYENNYDDFIEKYRTVYSQSSSTEGALKTQANMVWNFAFEMKEGDIIITPSSSTGYVLIGKIVSKYISNFDDQLNLHKSTKQRTDLFHLRKVEWLYVINSEDNRYSKLNKIGQLTVVKSGLSIKTLKSILNEEDIKMNETYTLSLSANPSGEIILGRLGDKYINELKKLHGSDDYSSSEFMQGGYLSEVEHGVYGIFGDDPCEEESVTYEITKEISFPTEDGFYFCVTALGEMSVDIEIDIPTGEEFDPGKLVVQQTQVSLNEFETEYGEGDLCYAVIKSIHYDGKRVGEDELNQLIDRDGIHCEFFIFQVKEGEHYLIHRSSANAEEWDDIQED